MKSFILFLYASKFTLWELFLIVDFVKVPPGLAGGAPGGPGGIQQAMFLQQQQQGMGGGRGAFGQAGPGGVLQGPLAFLEKTTSNIGITDGRR